MFAIRKNLMLCMEICFFIFLFFKSYLGTLIRKALPNPPKSLNNEVILITGSSNGIGRELALNLARNFPTCKLILWDIDDVENAKTLQMVKNLGVTVHRYHVDVSDHVAVETAKNQVTNDVGKITLLINNAGVAYTDFLTNLTPEQIQNSIGVNLLGNIWTIKYFLPIMQDENRGRIVSICSGSAFGGLRLAVPYAASKYGIRGLIDSLRSELRLCPQASSIKFNTVYPFFVGTQMTQQLKLKSKFESMNKFLDPVKVADRIVNGICRNEEHIFIPSRLELTLRYLTMLPEEFKARLEDWLLHESYVTNKEGRRIMCG